MRPALVLPTVTVLAAAAAGAAGAAAAGAAAALTASRVSSTVVQRQPAPGTCHARGHGRLSRPDPRCTPGAVDPTVTEANIGRTVCRVGYSEHVRPPEWITSREKRSSLKAYGDSGPLRAFEYDHLVPLELGGARNDPRNLWPQPGAAPNPKDGLENRLHRRVCAGELSLRAAQRAIAHNWVAANRHYRG